MGQGATAAKPGVRRPRVLVVDDDPEIADSTARALKSGCAVQVVHTTYEARLALSKHPFEAVISDYHLGAETAEALLAHIKDAHPAIRRVLYSATCTVTKSRLVDERLVHAAVGKPSGVAQLLAALHCEGRS